MIYIRHRGSGGNRECFEGLSSVEWYRASRRAEWSWTAYPLPVKRRRGERPRGSGKRLCIRRVPRAPLNSAFGGAVPPPRERARSIWRVAPRE